VADSYVLKAHVRQVSCKKLSYGKQIRQHSFICQTKRYEHTYGDRHYGRGPCIKLSVTYGGQIAKSICFVPYHVGVCRGLQKFGAFGSAPFD